MATPEGKWVEKEPVKEKALYISCCDSSTNFYVLFAVGKKRRRERVTQEMIIIIKTGFHLL